MVKISNHSNQLTMFYKLHYACLCPNPYILIVHLIAPLWIWTPASSFIQAIGVLVSCLLIMGLCSIIFWITQKTLSEQSYNIQKTEPFSLTSMWAMHCFKNQNGILHLLYYMNCQQVESLVTTNNGVLCYRPTHGATKYQNWRPISKTLHFTGSRTF